MIIILLFIINLCYSLKNKSIQYFYYYHILSLIALLIYLFNDIDVAYKINQNLPSDTFLYYTAYSDNWNNILNHTFGIYSYILRIIEYPFHDALFAVWGQVVITFLLLDIIVKNKRDLLFFISFHAIIYLNTNMFKDNLILIIGLLGYIILTKTKNIYFQSIIIFLSISAIAIVRPFLAIAWPICLLPFWIKIKSNSIKTTCLILSLILGLIIFYLNYDYIKGILSSFSQDTSLAEGKSSPIIGIIKTFLGPTPGHYLHADKFMAQAFLSSHSIFYCIMNILFYIAISFWLVYLLFNYKYILNYKNLTIDKLFLFAIGGAQLFVYILVYGSADIRQRAVIISYIYIASLYKQVYNRFYTKFSFYTLLLIITFLTILSYKSS